MDSDSGDFRCWWHRGHSIGVHIVQLILLQHRLQLPLICVNNVDGPQYSCRNQDMRFYTIIANGVSAILQTVGNEDLARCIVCYKKTSGKVILGVNFRVICPGVPASGP